MVEEDSRNPLSALTNCEILAIVYVVWSEAHFPTSYICYICYAHYCTRRSGMNKREVTYMT